MNSDSRKGVLDTLRHRDPDKIPIDLGATRFSGIHVKAYQGLRRYLSLAERTAKIYGVWQQLALPEEDLLNLFEVDVVGLHRMKVSFGLSNEHWKKDYLDDGSEVFVSADYKPVIEPNGDRAILRNGKVLAIMPLSGYYYDFVDAPLAKATTTSEIDRYPWDKIDQHEMEYLKREGESCFATGKAVVANYCGSIFHSALILRGYQQLYIELISNRPFVEYVFDKILEAHLDNLTRFISLGDRVQIIQIMADDLGGQKNLLISPKMYREIIKPRHKEIFAFIKKHTNWYILMHCDGAIRDIVPDFIEIGVDALNPIQTSAHGMDPEQLKKEFGKDLTFWGGGCDTQTVAPQANLEQIGEHVKERLKIFSPGGGFVFAPTMNFQPDTRPEIIAAVYETVKRKRTHGHPAKTAHHL
jgi:uroporphyrinogen decarboxylase